MNVLNASPPLEVESALAEAFGLGMPIAPMVPIARGAMGAVSKLETDAGEWAVKQLFDWARADNCETDVRLATAAAGAGVRVPSAARSASGNIVEVISSRRWRVYEWVDLVPEVDRPVSSDLAGQAGDMLAMLHGLELPASGPVAPWMSQCPPAERWARLARLAADVGATFAEALVAHVPIFEELSELVARKPADGPTILCHNDFGPWNVRRSADVGFVVLDWEHAGPQVAAWELGSALHAWAVGSGGQWSSAAARALVEGYTRGGGQVDLTLDMFRTTICGQLNWTASRAARALDASRPVEQARALAEVGDLVEHPVSVALFEQLVEAARA